VETKNGRRDFFVGALSTIVVVFFVSFLISAIYDSNFLFLKLAENQASEADFILLPRPTNRSTSPFLNFTALTDSLRNADSITRSLLEEDGGTAARWLAVAELRSTKEPTRTTTTTILVIDSKRERQVKMGRLFNEQYRALGKQEAYFSSTICAALGVPAKKGQRITMKIDLLELAGSLLGSETVTTSDDGSTSSLSDAIQNRDTLKSFLAQSLGINMNTPIVIPTQTLTNDIIVQAATAGRAGDTNAQLLAGVLSVVAPAVPATISVTFSQVFDTLYPTILETLNIEEEFIVVDEISSPNGKYPSGVGNVMLMELDDAHRLLRGVFLDILALIEPSVGSIRNETANNATEESAAQRNPLVQAYDSLIQASTLNLYHYSMQVSVQVKNRRKMYASTTDMMNQMVTDISDRLAIARPVNTTVSIVTPVAAAVSAFQFIRLFLDNIFNSMIFLLTLLGSLVIYSLMLGNVETKTYEYGMLRALGMPYTTLKSLLYGQASMYAISGVVVGMSVAGVCHLPLALYFETFSGLPIDLKLPDHGIIFGVAIGTIMPLVANYGPVRRALSSTLRDALDVYRKTSNAV